MNLSQIILIKDLIDISRMLNFINFSEWDTFYDLLINHKILNIFIGIIYNSDLAHCAMVVYVYHLSFDADFSIKQSDSCRWTHSQHFVISPHIFHHNSSKPLKIQM